jgi:hypothetical protein
MTAEQSKQWSQIVARAWADEAFKRRLLADPAAVLKEHGVELPTGIQVKVVVNTDRVVYLTLPLRPTDLERGLSAEELAQVVGGVRVSGDPMN